MFGATTIVWDGVNCLKPAYRIEALVRAAKEAADMSMTQAAMIREGGRATALQHDSVHERSKFQALLRDLIQDPHSALGA